MANYIEIPNLCPLNFVDKNRVLPANYHFKHFDAWKSDEQILPYDYAPKYYQKWQKNDIISIPVKSNFGPINVNIYDSNNSLIDTFLMDAIGNVGDDTYWLTSIALTDYEGCYIIEIEVGEGDSKITLESEEINIKESQEETLLFKYSNDFNNSVFWEAIPYLTMRVEGVISEFDTNGYKTVYIDQPNNSKTVKGVSSRQFKLFIGGSFGTPNYIPDKVQDIFDQTNVEIDGKGFSALNSGSKLTPKREELYGFAGWSLDIAETNNRRAKRFEIEGGLIEKKVVIDYIVEGKLFGPINGNANDNTYVIKEIE